MSKTLVTFLSLMAVLSFGSIGYMIIEKSSFIDSLYMTMITISTVGYGETVHLSPAGRYFTMVLILSGVGLVMFIFGEITKSIVEGGLQSVYGRMQMKKKVAGLQNHHIVCGFGRIGQVISRLLHEDGKPFVVIDNDPTVIARLNELGYLFLEGEASDDELLIAAGVKNARSLIAVVSSDADNVYITLSARVLNPNLFIMARASGDDGVDTKLLRAGANKVISPYYIGACRMAQHVLRPTVTDFIDLTVHGGELGLRLEELIVSEKAPWANKSLLETGIRKNFDLIVVAIKRGGEQMTFNPNPHTNIMAGDTLVVLGESEKIKQLEKEV
jgi:voltage-gated potassium channel